MNILCNVSEKKSKAKIRNHNITSKGRKKQKKYTVGAWNENFL